MLIIGLVMVFLLISLVSAKDYFLVCLDEGQTMEFSKCNPNIADRTCAHDKCPHCVYAGSKGFYCPATKNPNPCNALGLTCSSGNYTLDETSPNITYVSLQEGEIYEDDRLNFVGEANEISDWYSNEYPGGRFKKICSKKTTCEKRISFDEGLNNISIKVEDVVHNSALKHISFFVDSKSPKIRKTLPKKRSFFNGNFWVQYTEYNVKEMILTYGNYSVYKNATVLECADGKKQECEIDVDLSEFDGQEIEYWFTLKDIANNVDESKHVYGKVDISDPVLNNPDSFWSNELGSKYVYFNMSITEENFDEAFYTYIDSRGRTKEKRLCSRLKNGICEKKKRFSRGDYNLTIGIIDEAGNQKGYPINFTIDY